MKISESINIFKDHQKSCIKPKTLNSYNFLLNKQEPKSGRDKEVAFMPEQVAKRLGEYIQ